MHQVGEDVEVVVRLSGKPFLSGNHWDTIVDEGFTWSPGKVVNSIDDVEQPYYIISINSSAKSFVYKHDAAQRIRRVHKSGMRCLDCKEFYEYVTKANHTDGLVCYPCRTSNSWKWSAGLIKS